MNLHRSRYLPTRRTATFLLFALAFKTMAVAGEIHVAAAGGDLEKVRVLLRGAPALVSSKDAYGATPLHHAAGNGRKDVVALLLANKADLNAKDNQGFTPLQVALQEDRTDVVALLAASGEDVTTTDNKGKTPLHDAAFNGHKEAAELLLANKANVNARNAAGQTPLLLAAVAGRKDLAELLITNRAEVNAGEAKGARLYTRPRLLVIKMSLNYCWPAEPKSTAKTTTARLPYISLLLSAIRMSLLCFSTETPTSMPRTTMAMRL